MEEEISFEEIFKIIKQKIKMILLWSFVGLLGAGLYTFFIVTPLYESSSRIVVNQTQNTNQNITNTDIQTNLNLINTYQSIIREPIILEDVISKTNSKLSVNVLKNKISVQTQADSLVFGITVQDENPYVAAELANAIAESFENKIGDILEVQSVTILSEAVPNVNPVSPNFNINLILGFILGTMIGIGFSFLTELTDKTVKDNKIIENLGWTNLGSILEMSNDEVIATRMDRKVRAQNGAPTLSRRRV